MNRGLMGGRVHKKIPLEKDPDLSFLKPSFFFPPRTRFFLFVLFCLWAPLRLSALELDPYPLQDFSGETLSLSFFRMEKPSFYWVNIGVPDLFFTGVKQLSGIPYPVVYSVHGMEYGFQAAGWCTDWFQLRATMPFEADTLVDSGGVTQDSQKFGDLEIGAAILLAGKRESGSYLAVDGWFRFPTGTNPFNLAFPLLSSGKGAPEMGIGLRLGQEVGGFSFFQRLHYEKTDPVKVGSSNPLFGPGTFQWPENWDFSARFQYLLFHRAERKVGLYYELRLRMSGRMELNQQPVYYGQNRITDKLFFSTLGLNVRVDKEFTAEGKLTFFPTESDLFGSQGRPDYGWLFSLGLEYRPF